MEDTSQISELAAYLELISNGGIIVILLGGLWAFVTGKVFPRAYVDEIKRHSEDMTKLLAAEICERLENGFSEATERAIISAIEELNTPTHLRKRDVKQALRDKE